MESLLWCSAADLVWEVLTGNFSILRKHLEKRGAFSLVLSGNCFNTDSLFFLITVNLKLPKTLSPRYDGPRLDLHSFV